MSLTRLLLTSPSAMPSRTNATMRHWCRRPEKVVSRSTPKISSKPPMKPANYLILGTALLLLVAASAVSRAQRPPRGQILDPATVAWPRTFTADGHDMAVFQPQISTWKANQLAGRFAVGVRPIGSKNEAYGVVSF